MNESNIFFFLLNGYESKNYRELSELAEQYKKHSHTEGACGESVVKSQGT